MRIFSFTLLFFLLQFVSYSQDSEALDFLPTLSVPNDLTSIIIAADESIEQGFGKVDKSKAGGTIAKIDSESFNQGLLSHPLFNIQGRVSGVSVSRPGSNPFSEPQIRIRGISSLYMNSQPLIVIDGVPDMPLSMIAPEDISEVVLLKDAAASAIYGESGNAGVLLVKTHRSTKPYSAEGNPFEIDFTTKVGSETVADDLPVADRLTYLQLRPGSDFGGNTNWQEEVTRRSLSHTYQLNISKRGKNFALNAAGFNRNLQGVGAKTGGTDLLGRLNAKLSFLNDHLQFSGGAYAQSLNAVNDLREAFRYSRTFAPSAPIFEGTGGDYFVINQFDVFNPVAIQEQSISELRRSNLMTNFKVFYQPKPFLTGHFMFSQHTNTVEEGTFINQNSFFIGSQSGGFGEFYRNEQKNRQLSAWLDFDFNELDISVGWQLRRRVEEGEFDRAFNFTNSVSSFGGFSGFNANEIRSSELGTGYNTQAGWGRITYDVSSWLSVQASGRYAGSSRIQKPQRNALYPALTTAFNLGELLGSSYDKKYILKAAYAQTGNFPEVSGLGNGQFVESGTILFGGQTLPGFFQNFYPNPDLREERKSEWSLSLLYDNYSSSGLLQKIELNAFRNTIEDLIYIVGFNPPPQPTETLNIFANLDDLYLQNQGIELEVLLSKTKNKLTWSTGFNLSFLRTKTVQQDTREGDFELLNENGVFETFDGLSGGPGGAFDPVVQIAGGENFGQLVGVETLGINSDGTINYQDTNNDGFIGFEDRKAWGQATPSMLLGLQQQFSLALDEAKRKSLIFAFALRGEYGHSLFQSARRVYETLQPGISTNIVQTEFWGNGINDFQYPDDRLIENASYTAIDYISLSYKNDFEEDKLFRSVSFQLTLQNPIWFTGYTAGDPTPRYYSEGLITNGYEGLSSVRTADRGYAFPGIDRLHYYPRSQGIVLGLSFGF